MQHAVACHLPSAVISGLQVEVLSDADKVSLM